MISNITVMMILFAAEMIIFETIMCIGLAHRKQFLQGVLISAALITAYVFLVPLYRMGGFVQIPIVAVSFLYVFLCYETTALQALFITIAGFTIERISSLLNSMITLINPAVFAHFGNDTKVTLPGYLLILSSSAITCAAAYFVLIRRMKGIDLFQNATVPVILLGIMVLLTNQIWGFRYALYGEEYAAYSNSFQSFFEYLWNLICCILSLCIQFGIFSLSQKERELEIARRLMAEKEQQYAMSRGTIEAINRKCHNLKYELSSIPSGEDVQGHIDEAMALVDSFDSHIRTGNETLDIILTEKNLYCRQNHISFVCMIDGAKLNFMETTDLYVMFGNLIDNAIHAVEKLEDKAQRVIYITVNTEGKFILIRTENPFSGNVVLRDGLPVTSSGDSLNHGYGVVSIRLICEKYGGSISIKAEDGIFQLSALIPLSEDATAGKEE